MKKGIDKTHKFLTKKKLVVIIVIFITVVSSIFGIVAFFGKDKSDTSILINQSLINKDQIIENNYGNMIINIQQTITEVPNCPECPKMEYHPMQLYHTILIDCPECENFNSIEIDITNVKFNLPNGNSIFLDKLSYDDEMAVGLCDSEGEYCHIFPQYIFDINDKVCIEINISKFGEWNLNRLQKSIEERKCLTLHDTNIKLGNLNGVGLINHFRAPIEKEGKQTQVYSNYYKVKMLLPSGQLIYFDDFMYDESIIFAYCNFDKTDCYILPKYRYSNGDDVCLEVALGDDWGANGWMVVASEKMSSCIQEASSNKFFSEFPKCTTS